jgi:GT2 family glycosyltransferase
LLDEIRLSRRIERVARRLLGEARRSPDPTRQTEVDWLDGCCLMIRWTTVARIGVLDEQYFLYAEELDWCRSARAAGWRIVTCPEAEMTHLRGRSSDQAPSATLALLIETRLRYYRKHDGLMIATLVSLAYAIGSLSGWWVEPEKNRAKLRGLRDWWHAVLGRTSQNAPAVPSVTAAGVAIRRPRGV